MSYDLNDQQWEQIESHLYSGHKIAAIKLFREHTGASLAQSKQVIEQHESELRSQSPERFTRPAGKGCTAVLLAVVMLAIMGWLFVRA